MHLLTKNSERGLELLTRLAYGNVSLVRDALLKHGRDKKIDDLIEFVKERRGKPPYAPAPDKTDAPSS